MRMRKKKHLDERLAECESYIATYLFDYKDDSQKPLIMNDIFGNNNPVHLEIGCGKGAFVNTQAMQNPDINFLALEKSRNVIVTALESTKRLQLPNVRYIIGMAEYLERIIERRSIELIYLNFSCPFPKTKYAIHRLTHQRFLDIYKVILSENGFIKQKTDNDDFFKFSVRSFTDNGFVLKNITDDLHNSSITGNIKTEYEQMFSAKGIKINYLEASVKN